MTALRRLKATLTGQTPDKVFTELEGTAVPVSNADCRSCADPCEEEWHEPFPARFGIDMETQMLGSVKPYRRQVLISTGVSDWDKDVTDTRNTLANYLSIVSSKAQISPPTHNGTDTESQIPGVFASSTQTRLSILNGSHKTISADDENETVLVFPDYKVVADVPRHLSGAQDLWDQVLTPTLGRSGEPLECSSLKSWILPYTCVIMLCSHKKRDNRCAIAAPRLEKTFTSALEREGWEVHTQVEHPGSRGLPLEEFVGSQQEKEVHILDILKAVAKEKKALIVRNSHMGGHKYAGNCIIYTPQGTGVWYGRVSSHEVESIVLNTIVGGKVLPPLLRGGTNLSRPGCANLHDW